MKEDTPAFQVYMLQHADKYSLLNGYYLQVGMDSFSELMITTTAALLK